VPNTTVYFATNRVAQGPTTDWRSYGPDIVLPTDPSLIIYAAAFVDGIDLGAEGSGAITTISHAESGAFHPGVSQDILGSGKNILVFIHGFANSFLNSITRAAFNREWFAAAGVNAADTTVIAFSWPSLGQFIAATAPSPCRLPARPKSGWPVGLSHRELFRQSSTAADAGSSPGQAGVPVGAQHGQFRPPGGGGELVQPR
jgi:hypothetical protein